MAETLAELIHEGKDITEHLTDSERDRFDSCESIIHKGLSTFMEVGRALADINNNRLYREAYPGYTFEKYCKEAWDLSRGYAYQQIGGYETVTLLTSKMSAIADILETPSEEIPDQQEEKCTDCGFREALTNKTKGVKIPGEPGKCTRPEGLCEKHSQPADSPGRTEIILPINEAQTRPLTKLKNPDDQVKAWGIVLEKLNQDPKAKLTAALINKAVKEVQGSVVKKKTQEVRKAVETTALVTTMFKKQYQVLLDIVVEEQNNGWTSMKKTEVIKHLDGLIKIIKSED